MKAGSVACAPVSMDQSKSMTDLGLNLLIDLSLERLQRLLAALGHPERRLPPGRPARDPRRHGEDPKATSASHNGKSPNSEDGRAL